MARFKPSLTPAPVNFVTTVGLDRETAIAKAKAKGVYKGRPKKHDDVELVARIVAEAIKPGAVKSKVAAAHKISRETLYQYIRAAAA